MPMIRVELFEGRSKDQKARFAQAVTASFVECCGGTRESVQIVFTDVAREQWATAGQLESDRSHK